MPVTVADPQHPVRIVVFGAGKAAKFHLDALAQMRGVRVVAIVSRSGTTAAALAEPLDAMWGSSPEDFIDPERVDAAIVAVPHDHAPTITAQLLDARIPLLVEKPAAATTAEVRDLAARAAAAETIAVVGVNRRYYSLVGEALAAVRQRGPVRGVLMEAHEPTDLLRSQGGVGDNLAAWFRLNSLHYVDLLRYVGGEVDTVVAMQGEQRSAPGDHVSAAVRFRDGAIGTFLAHWNSGGPMMLRIYGDHVTAEIRLSQPERAFLEFTYKRRIALKPDWADTTAKPGVYAQDAAFLTAVADGGPVAPPASDLRDHIATHALVDDILTSR